MEITRIEPRHHIARPDPIADIDETGDHLAGHPESKVSLVARAHHAGEFAIFIRRGEYDALHLHRPDRRCGCGCCRIVAGGESGRERDHGEDRPDGAQPPPHPPPLAGEGREGAGKLA